LAAFASALMAARSHVPMARHDRVTGWPVIAPFADIAQIRREP
jgi:hypothetical protein